MADGQSYRGEVRWAERGRFGMEFTQSFDLALVASPRLPLVRAG